MQQIKNLLHSRLLLPLLFFAIIFLFFTYPMGLSDYWWHMNTGRWIWENMAIPEVDPFTYSYAKDDDTRRVVILQAYYLGQVFFYFIYNWFGIWGLLLLKASLLTFSLWLLWHYMRYRGVSSVVGLILITPIPFIIFRLDELRTVLFSFIGAIAVFYLIEIILDRLRSNKQLGLYCYALPATMLLWANLHRGFLIGWVLLLAYGFSETVKYFKSDNALSRDAYKTLVILFGISVLISLLNPNGYNVIVGNQAELVGPFMDVIDEYFPLWKYAKFYDVYFIFYGCAAIALFSIITMARHWRDVNYVHWFLLAGFVYEGFSTFRFSFFLTVMSLAIAAAYYKEESIHIVNRFPRTALAVGLCALFVLGGFGLQRTAFILGPWEKAFFPSDAAYFVLNHQPPGNLFNAFEYGGYLGWKLYPSYKIFIDQRNLDYSVFQEYGIAKKGDYREVFHKYNINTVVFYHTQPVTKRQPGIIKTLLNDVNWDLVHLDSVASVFVRAETRHNLPVINKTRAKQYLLQQR